MHIFVMLWQLCFVALAAAQSTNTAKSLTTTTTTTSVFNQDVPTDIPVAGDYAGALRPQVHFSPPKGFMNDPNGCFVDANGTWHLYYQYNPTADVAGNQHWGHATSRDLYTWENQQIALFATENAQIFSGSAVIDVNNTSGFFPNQTNGVVAIYTLNTRSEQTQDIAYSFDGGYTFEVYAQNPVLSIGSTQFRDPKVVWYEDHWVMVIAYSQEFVIGIFTSPNLKNWTHASNFSHYGLLGLQYECPNLVEMPMEGQDETMWLMAISINPGAPLGGSIMEYFPGTFNGTHFEAVDAAARISDFAKDNYAGQFFYGIPGDQPQVFMAWASNWQYTNVVPSGELEGWRSSMSVARETYLANVTRTGYTLINKPYNITPIYEEQFGNSTDLGNSSLVIDYSSLYSGAVYFSANVSNLPNTSTSQGTLNFTFSCSYTKESISGGFYFGGDNPFWLTRGDIKGFDNPFFTDKFSTGQPLNSNGTFLLEGIIDRSIAEVFLDGGRNSATMTFFPAGALDTMEIRASGLNAGVEIAVEVWGLKSTWEGQEDDEGMVLGNVTESSGGNSTQMVRRDMKLRRNLRLA